MSRPFKICAVPLLILCFLLLPLMAPFGGRMPAYSFQPIRLHRGAPGVDRFELPVPDPLALESMKPEAWQAVLAVYVDQPGSKASQDQLPVLGSYRVEGRNIVFQPRFS